MWLDGEISSAVYITDQEQNKLSLLFSIRLYVLASVGSLLKEYTEHFLMALFYLLTNYHKKKSNFRIMSK